MSLLNLTATQLIKAAGIAGEIERLNAELAKLFGSSASAPAPVPAAIETAKTPGKRGPKKGGMSAAGRAAIAAAQKARWAKHKQNALKVEAAKIEWPKAARPAKRKMSAEGRARIIAAQKARWAKVRAGKKR
jgi:hypothetical protein